MANLLKVNPPMHIKFKNYVFCMKLAKAIPNIGNNKCFHILHVVINWYNLLRIQDSNSAIQS